MKGGNTIKNLCPLRTKTPSHRKVIYRYKCDRLECDGEYIDEAERTFGEGLKKHFRAPSPIYDHADITGHHTNVDNFSIVGR